ncbi:uncharacterized protein ARMOST_06067 [Armillaria ostoyae]|uniref:Uncharacterized protein n=1 Tax=Armillaria ostoyae TaxID=47428 RepID=A0A284R1Y9_ARMOS|nr:uncharacterized protein ARMOST_06067 [Armillaria ostoyae]
MHKDQLSWIINLDRKKRSVARQMSTMASVSSQRCRANKTPKHIPFIKFLTDLFVLTERRNTRLCAEPPFCQ